MDVKWEGFGARSIQDAVDEGVRRGYNNPDNKLRASVLSTRFLNARTPRTTRQPWSSWNWCPAIRWT
jgi:tartrate dehydratase alpha subunit/fumarate hydratase class I-like protein